ncbi:hypothetical protein ACLOJK_033728 [Asimina triloba]
MDEGGGSGQRAEAVASAGSDVGRRRRVRAVTSVVAGGRLTEVVMTETMDGLDPLIQASLMTRNGGSSFWENGWPDGLEKKTPWAAFMARFRSEMGHDRSGMMLNLLMTSEEDSPRVASMINVGLRSRRIWNVLVVAVVMNDLDRGSDGSAVVGLGRPATASSWASFAVRRRR